MIGPGHVYHGVGSLANLRSHDICLCVSARFIEQARPDTDWNYSNVAKIDQLSLSLARIVVRSILLPTVLDGVLSPMHLRLD